MLVALAALGAVLAPDGETRRSRRRSGRLALAVCRRGDRGLALGGGRRLRRIPTSLAFGDVWPGADRAGRLLHGRRPERVGAVAALFAIGYVGTRRTRAGWAALPVFLVGMQLVPAAADAVSFLLAWELMALSSTVLVLTEHARPRQTSAPRRCGTR